jgi:hypothetical protein
MAFIRFPLCPVVDIKESRFEGLDRLRDHLAGNHPDHVCLGRPIACRGFCWRDDRHGLDAPRLQKSVWPGGRQAPLRLHKPEHLGPPPLRHSFQIQS